MSLFRSLRLLKPKNFNDILNNEKISFSVNFEKKLNENNKFSNLYYNTNYIISTNVTDNNLFNIDEDEIDYLTKMSIKQALGSD